VAINIKETGVQLKFTQTHAENIPDLRKTGQQVAFFDMNRLTFPLIVRTFQPGDRFTPLGMTGTQKVKDFFINHKVPRSDRSRCPILLNRDKIIWIVGHRIDDSVKVTDATGDILKVELFLAE
jgi:tRNA(Ile)-lysidine synthase